jgi:hypothetical protein
MHKNKISKNPIFKGFWKTNKIEVKLYNFCCKVCEEKNKIAEKKFTTFCKFFQICPFFSQISGTKYIPIPSPSVRSPIAVDHHFCHFCPLLGGTLPDPIFGPKTGNFGNFCKKLCFFLQKVFKIFR